MEEKNPKPATLGANASPTKASQEQMARSAISPSLPLGRADGRHDAKGSANHALVLRVIQKEGPGILRMLWRILGREQDVMDAYQDCFCKLAQGDHLAKADSAKSYTYRTASNIAVEIIRTRKRRTAHWAGIVATHQPKSAPEQEPVNSSLEMDRLREAISELPTHLQHVVVLRDLSRMAYEQVGKTLGITPATARVYRRHAVVRLAELLGEGNPS